jgi:hypothetical protein
MVQRFMFPKAEVPLYLRPGTLSTSTLAAAKKACRALMGSRGVFFQAFGFADPGS